MGSTTQKRWLTAKSSKLTKADIVAALRHEDAWGALPEGTRRVLYARLAPVLDSERLPDIDIHPLQTRLRPYIEEELRQWQNDVREGREGKKWREDAMRASRDHISGKWDEWKEMQKHEKWGEAPVEMATGSATDAECHEQQAGELMDESR